MNKSTGKKRREVLAVELRKAIEAGERAPFYLLWGEEEFEREQCFAWLKDALMPAIGADFNLTTFHGERFVLADFLDVYQSYPLMATHRLVVIKECEKLATEQITELETIIDRPAETTCLIVLGGKIDMRRKWFQGLANQGVVCRFQTPYENKVPQWIKQQAQLMDVEIEPQAADLLAQYVGNQLRELHSELEKLVTFVGASKQIKAEHIKQQVGISRAINIFGFTDALGKRELRKAFQMLHGLLGQDEEPGRILAMVNRHIQLLLKTQDLLKARASKEETAKKLGVSPYFVTNYIAQARQLAPQVLWRNMAALLAADIALKSSGRRNQGAIMDLLVARLCGV